MVNKPKRERATHPTIKKGKDFIGSRRLPFISFAIVSLILGSYAVFLSFPQITQNLAYATSDEKAYAVDTALVAANTKFAFNLFRELVAEDMNTNIFISPLSISTALTMTYNGAGGTTRDAMAEALEFGSMSLATVNRDYANLIGSLANADEQVDILIGNSIWLKKEFEPLVKADFLERVKTSFTGEILTRDFENPQTITDINGWVDEKTRGEIEDMIQTIEPELVMFVLNALYFKGDWVTKFDEAKTQKQDFFLPDEQTVNVDMMSTSGTFRYYSGETFHAARLPYGRDKIAMYIFLPKEGVPLDSFIANLNPTTHEDYISRLSPVDDLTIKLPKFTVEYGVKRLNTILEKLGMEIAFNPLAADLSGIASTTAGKLYISYVDHKATIEVNEQGTEAAAATSVGIGLTAVPPSFVVNRPFFFEIRDDRSGSILFMGKILNPTQT
jgi:serine protease inhibitor